MSREESWADVGRLFESQLIQVIQWKCIQSCSSITNTWYTNTHGAPAARRTCKAVRSVMQRAYESWRIYSMYWGQFEAETVYLPTWCANLLLE